MTRIGLVVGWLFVALLASGPAAAQQMFIFPQKGQDQAQQDQDRGALVRGSSVLWFSNHRTDTAISLCHLPLTDRFSWSLVTVNVCP